jgi:hypothetical protein
MMTDEEYKTLREDNKRLTNELGRLNHEIDEVIRNKKMKARIENYKRTDLLARIERFVRGW